MAGLLSAHQFVGDPVARELRQWAGEPFDWTTANCGLAILRYVERVRGRRIDPQPAFVGRNGAALMLARAGGFEGYCAWAMAQLDCLPTDAPIRGDVALVDLPGSGLTACVCVDDARGGSSMWAARGDHAVVIQPGAAVAAWSVSCRKR